MTLLCNDTLKFMLWLLFVICIICLILTWMDKSKKNTETFIKKTLTGSMSSFCCSSIIALIIKGLVCGN
jgi:uncharacterized membrane protein